MNNSDFQHYLWPYALRGSVTIIVENTSIENFERSIYRYLRQSIAKIVRTFCSHSRQNCLSQYGHAIRADHVIIQSYEEQLDDRRLYVAVFIKDPYRQDIALTNEQFLLALKRNQQQLYHDIKHHINLPSNFFQETSLDPIWLYGVCLLALLVLVVVILMLITILAKRTMKNKQFDQSTPKSSSKMKNHREQFSIIVEAKEKTGDDDRSHLSTLYNESEINEGSSSIIDLKENFFVNPTTSTNLNGNRVSYFNSAFEAALKKNLHDDEPIPFIDENLSLTHSRKSSACWSDRTSLSSRFSFAKKLNLIRSNVQSRPNFDSFPLKTTRRFQYRTVRCPIPNSKKIQNENPL